MNPDHKPGPEGIERLRELYALMQGIPDNRVNLFSWRTYGTSDHEMLSHSCGALACAVGWACIYPPFMEQGLSWKGAPNLLGKGAGWRAVSGFFQIHEYVAEVLFQAREASLDFHREGMYGENVIQVRWAVRGDPRIEAHKHTSDKAIVLRRIRRYLMYLGAITSERNAELAKQEGMPE